MPTCPTCDADIAAKRMKKHKKMHRSKLNNNSSPKVKTVTCETCGAQVPESKKEAHERVHTDAS
jgi:ribosomal protein S26